jgi:hypothetical protein
MNVAKLQPYAKALVALAAFLGVLGAAFADGTVSESEAGAIISSAIGVVAVYQVRNKTVE